ncbi:MAG: neutral/alkaline non-lysosomal ceramidase N-terminal domain-containing protein [Acidobacteria bacterium]|nr:neutral/alkaline non-lysosomal ceramidase N-terminal domain-containing protein [Acidobacteriota bacterium]
MKKTAFLLAASVLALTAVRADVVEQGVKDSAPSGLLAGVARADITPPVGIAQMNWGSQTHVVAAGVDPIGMYATALVLSDGRQKFAMVDIDAGMVDGMEDIVRRASALTGIPELRIRLAATHTHSGPYISAAKGPAGIDLAPHRQMLERYRLALADKVVGAIVEANSRLQPAHLYGDRGVGRININRRVRAQGGMPAAVGRNPEGFTDRELVVIRIDDAQGKPLAILANYQCHGTVLAYENQLLSPDWIGAMRRVVEQAMPGAKCLFFQGAAGNQGPIEGFTGDLAVAHRLGTMLGHEVAAVAYGIQTVRREPRFEGFVESTAYQAKQHWRVLGPRDATIKFATKVLELPPRRYTPREIDDMETLVADAKKKLEAAEASSDPWKKHQAEARLRRFADLLADWKRPPDPTPVKVRVQILRIGEVAIVAMPGEPFAEIGAAVKKASPFAVTMFCGYSNGEGGDYMPVEPEYALGGYEVQRTPYGTGAAEKLIRETIPLFQKVQ